MAKINPRRTKALDNHPALKGGQSRLPDALQAKIIGSKLRKTAELNKVAFAYKRDALGALGGSLLGGGLGYASSTDGKNNTPDNRLKRTLIGAGIGGGVGLGFGRMSRKLKGAQDNFADARSRLDTANSRIRSQDEAYDTLSKQRDRLQDDADLLRRQKDELQDEYREFKLQSRRQAHEAQDELRKQHASHDAELRESRSRERRLSEEVERYQLRAQVRGAMDPNNPIPESAILGMTAGGLQTVLGKRARRANAQNAVKTSAWAPQLLGGRAFTKTASDLEGRMAKRQLTEICEMAQELLMYMSDEEDLHEWVQNKITTIHDRLSSVHSYVSYEKKNPPMMMQPQMLGAGV